MSDLTPETIAHLRELDAARTQGEWAAVPGALGDPANGPDHMRVVAAPHRDAHTSIARLDYEQQGGADAEFIATAANHMSALLDAAEERNQLRAAWVAHEAEVSRLRAELAEARAVIERVTALADEYERRGEYGDASLTWGARDIRAALAPVTQREEGGR